MEAQSILVSDYLDILFQARNKEYGSYELRKNYTRRLQKALLFIMMLCSVLVLLSMRRAGSANHALPISATPIQLVNVQTEVPVLPKPIVLPPPATAVVKVPSNTLQLKVVADNAVIDLKPVLKAEPEEAPAGVPGTNTSGDIASGNSGGFSKVILPPSPVESPDSKPIRYVEQMPQFDELNEYLSTHLRYPEAAKDNNIQGKVSVEFVVNEDGSITNARVVRGIGSGCDQEALRVINGMPKWKPGKQNGKAVKVYFVLPTVFVLH